MMKSIKLRNGRLHLEATARQFEGDKRHLLGLIASYDRASKTLVQNAALLSESRQLILEAERLLSVGK
jgi:hypothetical protein